MTELVTTYNLESAMVEPTSGDDVDSSGCELCSTGVDKKLGSERLFSKRIFQDCPLVLETRPFNPHHQFYINDVFDSASLNEVSCSLLSYIVTHQTVQVGNVQH